MCYMTTTALRRFPRVLLETWGYFEALRRLGFSSNDIYFATAMGIPDGLAQPVPVPCIFVILRHGDEEFVINAGPYEGEAEMIEKMWLQIVAGVGDGTYDEEELQIVWDRSKARTQSVDFVIALRHKGIPLPATTN
jgi:hypothetical protein